MKNIFFFIFVFLSFITQTIDSIGGNPILSRLTLSDVFGALALVFGLNSLYKGVMRASSFSKVYQGGFFLVITFLLPILFSLNIAVSLVECLILFFLLLLSIGMFENFKDNLEKSLLPLVVYTLITASILGFYDLFASVAGLPRIFPSRNDGEALSGFRNAGQAGAYFMIMLTIVIPLRYSSLSKKISSLNIKLLNISIILGLLFFFVTGKIAAYIGIVVGVFLFLIYKRNFTTFIGVTAAGLMLFFVYLNLNTLAPDTHRRIQSKYESRITGSIENINSGEDSFIKKNIGHALQAFEDRPIIGTGIGAISGNYGRHETHSTYFKMIGETGLLGVFGYFVFIISFLTLFRIRRYKKINPYADYLASMVPFLMGCFVSWSYTYHLRKREFWILTTIVVICVYRAIEYNKELKRKEEIYLEKDKSLTKGLSNT